MKPDFQPDIPDGLVDFLRQTFRDRLPSSIADATPSEIARRIGQQEVIRHLEQLYAVQQESDHVSP